MVRAAASLDTLLGQLNTLAPKRAKGSDGGAASQQHSLNNPTSDHEPDRNGVYHARDFTHDPKAGADMTVLIPLWVMDKRANYGIHAGKFYDKVAGKLRIRDYAKVNPTGNRLNPHDKHGHLSVFYGALGEDKSPWSMAPAPAMPINRNEEPEMNAVETQVAADRHTQLINVLGQIQGSLAALTAEIRDVKLLSTESRNLDKEQSGILKGGQL